MQGASFEELCTAMGALLKEGNLAWFILFASDDFQRHQRCLYSFEGSCRADYERQRV